MTNPSSLIAWKTQAWTDPNMVAWYAGQMVNTSGTNSLKNAIERRFIDQNVVGSTLLDVGIGTGRASLPLAQRGYKVTGIDYSQAMLDETLRQAGSTPIDLRQGDITRLPVDNAAYDCILSLNVMVHFPHWEMVLNEWKRALRPGGRIIFDVHSYDHLAAIYPPAEAKRYANAGLEAEQHGGFIFHLYSHDLFDWADANGFRVAGIIPVGGLWSKGNVPNYALSPLERRHDWQRLLSWLETDRKMLDFSIFLEETIVRHLPPQATRRYFAVLDFESDQEANVKFRQRIDTQFGTLLEGSLENPASGLPLNNPEWQATLAGHLKYIRNRHLFYRLFNNLRNRLPWLSTKFIPEPFASLFDDWELQDTTDQITRHITKNWSQSTSLGQQLEIDGVPLASILEYSLTEALLTQTFGVFTGNRS